MTILFALLLAVQPYHIDFTRIFASPEAEKADRQVLARDLAKLAKLRGNVSEELELNEAIQIRLARHDMYLYLRCATNTEDVESCNASDALDAEVASKTAFLRGEILRLPEGKYRHEIESIRRWRAHTLPDEGEKALSAAEPVALNWQFDLYEKLKPQLQPDLVAFTLIRLASSRNAVAHLRHFADAVEWSYFGSYLTRAEVRSLLQRVAQNADLYKRYQRARQPSTIKPQFSIDDARRILLESTAPLGPDYARELAALLDPANGRLDILPGPHRKPGGFSQGTIGTDSVFYSAGFTGSYNDVRILMHESTHAVQRQFMNAAHVPFADTNGPKYFAEALAIFNELGLADFMAAHSSEPAEQRFYRQQFVDGKGMIAFVVAPEAELEEAVYDGVAAGTIHGVDDLDRITQAIYEKYTISPDPRRWMKVQLMYEDPFYDLNYVYGGIIALRMYAMYTQDPAAFAPKYIALMRNGYTAPPDVLLKKFLGIDLHDPAVLDSVVDLLKARVK